MNRILILFIILSFSTGCRSISKTSDKNIETTEIQRLAKARWGAWTENEKPCGIPIVEIKELKNLDGGNFFPKAVFYQIPVVNRSFPKGGGPERLFHACIVFDNHVNLLHDDEDVVSIFSSFGQMSLVQSKEDVVSCIKLFAILRNYELIETKPAWAKKSANTMSPLGDKDADWELSITKVDDEWLIFCTFVHNNDLRISYRYVFWLRKSGVLFLDEKKLIYRLAGGYV